MRNNINNPDHDLDITFKKSIYEMYDKLKQYSECPVCYETLTKSNMEVPNADILYVKVVLKKSNRALHQYVLIAGKNIN